MCSGVEIAGLVLGGLSAAKSLSSPKESASSQPAAPPAVEPPPAAAKTPDQPLLKRKNAATALTGPMAGPASTMLTGPAGIADNMLNLGKNDKLGQ